MRHHVVSTFLLVRLVPVRFAPACYSQFINRNKEYGRRPGNRNYFDDVPT